MFRMVCTGICNLQWIIQLTAEIPVLLIIGEIVQSAVADVPRGAKWLLVVAGLIAYGATVVVGLIGFVAMSKFFQGC